MMHRDGVAANPKVSVLNRVLLAGLRPPSASFLQACLY
jgi:hypothetical protein